MDIFSFNTLDLIVIGLTALMALKGLFNGFLKELGSLIGLIAGVYLASRFSDKAATFLQESVLKIEDTSLLKLIGFMLTLIVVWVLFVSISGLVCKLKNMGTPSFLSRVLGFVVGGAKYFVIIALIVTAFSNVKFIQDNFKKYIDTSITYPHLNKLGATLLNIPQSTSSSEVAK